MDAERKQLVLDYQIAFDSDSGRRVLEDLAKHCRYNEEIDCDDAMVLQLATGMRNVFLYIKRKIDTNLDEERQENVDASD